MGLPRRRPIEPRERDDQRKAEEAQRDYIGDAYVRQTKPREDEIGHLHRQPDGRGVQAHDLQCSLLLRTAQQDVQRGRLVTCRTRGLGELPPIRVGQRLRRNEQPVALARDGFDDPMFPTAVT